MSSFLAIIIAIMVIAVAVTLMSILGFTLESIITIAIVIMDLAIGVIS